MSLDFHLITRRRPDARAFARTISEAAGRKVAINGDFNDPDDYLNISADDGLWIEVGPPGHVEYDDLTEQYPQEFGIVLPEPDDEGCLWYTTAHVPAGAPSSGADVILEAFERLARTHEGIALPAV